MSATNEGKTPKPILELILKKMGSRRNEIVVGPGEGVDAGVVDLGAGMMLAVSTDPMTYIPELGPVDSAALSVRSLLADVASSGIPPKYALFCLNLPTSMRNRDLLRYWRTLSEECRREGIAILGGHTGSYPGADYTIIGSGTVLGTGPRELLFRRNIEEGDDIIMTKTSAIEATALLPRLFPEVVTEKLGRRCLVQAKGYLSSLSIMNDCKAASYVHKIGLGISGVHDAAEGGIVKAVYELVRGRDHGAKIYRHLVPVSNITLKICQLFGVDPIFTLGQGSLIIACRHDDRDDVLDQLRQRGVPCCIIGEVTGKGEGVFVCDGEKEKQISDFADPYWEVYQKFKG